MLQYETYHSSVQVMQVSTTTTLSLYSDRESLVWKRVGNVMDVTRISLKMNCQVLYCTKGNDHKLDGIQNEREAFLALAVIIWS